VRDVPRLAGPIRPAVARGTPFPAARARGKLPSAMKGAPGAKQGDTVVGIDTHVIMIPSPGGPVPTPMPMPFNGQLSSNLKSTVLIAGKAAAVKGSVADNSPQHVPAGGPFQKSPSNQGTVDAGSETVLFENAKAARMGDPAKTCNDPEDAPTGVVVAAGTVLIG
jgi:uncharacterized Zn-binding protein involved in type VI secretion